MTNTKSIAAFFLVLVSAITLRASDAAAQSLTFPLAAAGLQYPAKLKPTDCNAP